MPARGFTNGFTLIELLVVLSIIAILSMVGLVAYSSTLQSARDARRQADLKVIQSALESYYNDQKYYPPEISFGGNITSPDGNRVYLNLVPNDPSAPNKHYTYEPNPTSCTGNSCVSYCLYADGENINPPITAPGCSGNHTIAVTSP